MSSISKNMNKESMFLGIEYNFLLFSSRNCPRSIYKTVFPRLKNLGETTYFPNYTKLMIVD